MKSLALLISTILTIGVLTISTSANAQGFYFGFGFPVGYYSTSYYVTSPYYYYPKRHHYRSCNSCCNSCYYNYYGTPYYYGGWGYDWRYYY